MKYLGWRLVLFLAISLALTACDRNCLTADTNRPCTFIGTIGIPI